MARTNVDYARDDIIDLVEGMPSGRQAPVSDIKSGLASIISNRTLGATAEAACGLVAYWRKVADDFEYMPGQVEDAGAATGEHLLSLHKLSSEKRIAADRLQTAMRDVLIELSSPRHDPK